MDEIVAILAGGWRAVGIINTMISRVLEYVKISGTFVKKRSI